MVVTWSTAAVDLLCQPRKMKRVLFARFTLAGELSKEQGPARTAQESEACVGNPVSARRGQLATTKIAVTLADTSGHLKMRAHQEQTSEHSHVLDDVGTLACVGS